MALLETALGIILLAVALIVPGYCIALGIFPSRKEIDGIERITFSLVFSIALMPLLMLIENQLLGIPINFSSVAGTILFLVVVGLLVWAIRTQKLKAPQGFYKYLPPVEKEEAVGILFWK